MNNDLRKEIVTMITRAGEGHIPSSFSILDIIAHLYDNFLRVDPKNPRKEDRDHFVLSKGHGCAALIVVLKKHGFLKEEDLHQYGTYSGILGGHPDRTKVPGAEASTGSLGHGLGFGVGIALGKKIRKIPSKVITLVGDGECHEGTVWESALVAQNLKLNNLCCVVDYNGSAAQILPHPDIQKQWEAFGWETVVIDGHSTSDLKKTFEYLYQNKNTKPLAVIAKTVKGKGVSFLETHGPWHHRIPNPTEFGAIMKELDQ